MPVYRISFELYENGVSRDLKLDYGDFALKGDLKSLDVQAETPVSARSFSKACAARFPSARRRRRTCRGSCRWRPPYGPGARRSDRQGRPCRHRRIAEIRCADADEAEGGAVAGRFQELARRIEQAGGELGRREARAGAGQQPEILVLQLQRHAAAGKAAGLEPARDLLREPPQDRLEILEGTQIRLEGGFRRDALRFPLRRDRPAVLAPGEPGRRWASRPRASNRVLAARRADATIWVTPTLASRLWAEAPMPGMMPTGLSARKSAASSRPMMEKPRGFWRSEAILARNLL